MTKPRKKAMKIALLFLIIVILLTQCNYAVGIDFRLKRMLKNEKNTIGDDVYSAFYDSLHKNYEKVDFYNEEGYSDPVIVCVYNDRIYYVELMKWDARSGFVINSVKADGTDTRTHYIGNLGNIDVPLYIEGLMSGEDDMSSYFEYTAYHCYCYNGEIVVQNRHTAVIYNLKEDTAQKIDINAFYPSELYDKYKNVEIEDDHLTVKTDSGDTRTLTVESMAQLDKTAKKLYNLSKSTTSIFRPKIRMRFAKAVFDDDGMYMVMLVQDSGGTSYLVYYRYDPESNTLMYWHSTFIFDEADRIHDHIVPVVD